MVIPSKKLLLTNIVQVTQAGKTEPERIKYGTTPASAFSKKFDNTATRWRSTSLVQVRRNPQGPRAHARMAAGITDKFGPLRIRCAVEAAEPAPSKRGPYKKRVAA
jgi:hypothetical protein